MKTKMAHFASGSLKYLICAEDKKHGSAEEEGILDLKVGVAEAVTQVDLK